MQRAIHFFLQREERRLNRTFSDVQLPCGFLRVDKDLRGDKVKVRFDPFQEPDGGLIYSLDGEYLDTGFRHQREGQQGDADVTPASTPKVKHNYLELLIEQHQQTIDRQSSGINYEAVMAAADRRWPFTEFAKQLAVYLGRRGGLSAFRTDELELLQKSYQRLKFLEQFRDDANLNASIRDEFAPTDARSVAR